MSLVAISKHKIQRETVGRSRLENILLSIVITDRVLGLLLEVVIIILSKLEVI